MESSVQVTEEQIEILNTGRAFASLESSAPYKALIGWIEGFEKLAQQEGTAFLKSGAPNDAYHRMCIRRDTACELRMLIQEKIAEIKEYAATIAKELKGE